MANKIGDYFIWYANKVAETVQYTDWTDKFCREQLKEATDKLLRTLSDHINWYELTKKEAVELGFFNYGEKPSDIYLIPLYLLPILPIGFEVIRIDGRKIIYDGTNLDNDVRVGCISYGIRIKE